MWEDPVTVRLDTLLAVIRWRRAEPHPILAATPFWYDDAALAAVDQRARDELDHYELGDNPEFEDAIGALVRPDRERFGWVNATSEDRPISYGVLAVAAHQVGLLLVRHHATDHVTITPIRPNELTSELVEQLPPVPQAVGEQVCLPYDDYLTATAPPGDGFTGLRARDNPVARELHDIVTRPRTGAGNLYTAARSTCGTRRRNKRPINYIDTHDGRWLTILTDIGNQVIVTAIPASPKHITRLLEVVPT